MNLKTQIERVDKQDDTASGRRLKQMLNGCLEEDDQLNINTAKLARQMQQLAFSGGINGIVTTENQDRKMATSLTMSPKEEKDGLITAGGRLRNADLTLGRKYPTVIPDGEYGDALIGYLHSPTEHQGKI